MWKFWWLGYKSFSNLWEHRKKATWILFSASRTNSKINNMKRNALTTNYIFWKKMQRVWMRKLNHWAKNKEERGLQFLESGNRWLIELLIKRARYSWVGIEEIVLTESDYLRLNNIFLIHSNHKNVLKTFLGSLYSLFLWVGQKRSFLI